MMTTNYTHIINENLDMFYDDSMETIVSDSTATRKECFTIINADEFNGNIDGLCNGWRIEYKKGEAIEFGGITFVYGYIEDDIEEETRSGYEYWSFRMAKLNGWIPTGRVMFAGYFEESVEFIEEDGKYETVYNEA